jgi:hypothetical protein
VELIPRVVGSYNIIEAPFVRLCWQRGTNQLACPYPTSSRPHALNMEAHHLIFTLPRSPRKNQSQLDSWSCQTECTMMNLGLHTFISKHQHVGEFGVLIIIKADPTFYLLMQQTIYWWASWVWGALIDACTFGLHTIIYAIARAIKYARIQGQSLAWQLGCNGHGKNGWG